jgi:DHA1 family bicyclomycin/chloramphenicol resistance-like MFS transporter
MLLFITVLTICIISRSEADFFIPCIPALQKYFDLLPFAVQLSLSLNFLGYCIGGLIAGFLGDKFNYRVIIISSLAIFAGATLLCAIVSNYSIVLFGRFVQGFSIAGPTVLSYVILIETSKFQDQLKRLGLINGSITLIMTMVPTIGSYFGLYSSWRFNFLAVFCLTLVALFLSYKVLETRSMVNSNITISLPFKEYFMLIKSRKLLIFTGALCFIIAPYWVFISMSPIYYVNDLGVPLIEYIWYKNILAIIFGVISLMNGLLVDKFGCKNCFLFSVGTCFISIIFQFIIVLLSIDEPKIITIAMAILTVGTAFLINFLYANALTTIKNHMGKVSVVIHSVRLIFTSISLSIVSKLYYGNFFVIGITLISLMFTGLLITVYLYYKGYLKGVAI